MSRRPPVERPRLRGGPDVVMVLVALIGTAAVLGWLVAALVTGETDGSPVWVAALLAPACLGYLVWIGPFGFWRIEPDGITIRSLFGRWVERTLPWSEVSTIAIHTSISARGASLVRVEGRIWHGASPLYGVTRPLRILAAAAERGLLPAHLTVLVGHAMKPKRPAGRRHLRRLREAGVRIETRVDVDLVSGRRREGPRPPGPPPPPPPPGGPGG